MVKNLPANTGVTRNKGLIPGSGGSPGEGKDNPLQYSCLKNFMDRGVWWATVHGVAESDTAEHTCTQGDRMHRIFFAFYTFSPFEIIVDSHAVARNSTERSRVSFIQFHPTVASCIIMKDLGFPGGSDGKDSAPQCGRHRFDPWVGKIPWRREWQPTPVFLP